MPLKQLDYFMAPNPMTDEEVIAALNSDTPLNAARRIFSSESAKIEQAWQQRSPISPVEWRRMEFEAVRKIAAALNCVVE